MTFELRVMNNLIIQTPQKRQTNNNDEIEAEIGELCIYIKCSDIFLHCHYWLDKFKSVTRSLLVMFVVFSEYIA